MQLSALEAIKLGSIELPGGIEPQPRKNCSLDLTVGLILRKSENGDVEEESFAYTIEPQETVLLISTESLHIKEWHIAYVFLKNRLSQQGILAINTGIVNEGHKGQISTLATNLSEKPVDIQVGTEFFRVVVHRFGTDLNGPRVSIQRQRAGADPDLDDEEALRAHFIKEKKYELKKFPNSFMDREHLKNEINEEVRNSTLPLSVRNLTIAVSFIGLLLAIFTIFAPHLQSYLSVPSGREITEALGGVLSIKNQHSFLEQQIEQNETEAAALRDLLAEVRMEMASRETVIKALHRRMKALEDAFSKEPAHN